MLGTREYQPSNSGSDRLTVTSTNSNTSEAESANQAPLLEVKDLKVHFPVKEGFIIQREVGQIKAVDGVNLHVRPGETLGLVGESGSGKTTCARTILRALKPTNGEAIFRTKGKSIDLVKLTERELKPLRTQMQMIFQDPFSSLNPRMTVGDIVGEPLYIHKLARGKELIDRVDDMLVKVGMKPEHRQRYPHAFSGGQRQRIGIARALIMRPSLVVCDEAVSALDVSVQAQVINLLEDLQEELNLTYLFVAHDLSVVRHISNRVAVMHQGKIVEIEETEAIFENPQHAYTRMLLSAIPHPDPDVKLVFTPLSDPTDS